MLWGWGVFLWVGGQGYLACVLANLEPMNLEPLGWWSVMVLNCASLNRGSWWQPLDYLRRLKVLGRPQESCVYKAIHKVRIRFLLLYPLPPETSFSTLNKKII